MGVALFYFASDLPDADTLAKYTEQVRADARVPESLAAYEKAEAGGEKVMRNGFFVVGLLTVLMGLLWAAHAEN